jgi:hypothetical protein
MGFFAQAAIQRRMCQESGGKGLTLGAKIARMYHRRADDLALRTMNRSRARTPGDPIRSLNIPPFEVSFADDASDGTIVRRRPEQLVQGSHGASRACFRFLKCFVGGHPGAGSPRLRSEQTCAFPPGQSLC